MKIPKLPGQKYVYVFEIKQRRRWGWQLLGRTKAGHSDNPTRRAGEFENSVYQEKRMDIEVVIFAAVPVFWYRIIERILHNAYPICWLRTKEFEPANGGTECFKVFNWLCGLIVYVACWWWGLDGLGLVLSLFIMFQPRPVDMATYLWVLYIFQLAIVAIIAGALIWVLWCLFIAGLAA